MNRFAAAAVTQPLSVPVAADDAAYLRRKGSLRLAVRTLRDMARFQLSGHRAGLRHAIDPGWRRAVWIHDEAPQIGDALMDLAPRSLLAAIGLTVDLLTAPHLAALFRGDRWLRRSADSVEALGGDHDFVIVSSHSRRALARKRGALSHLPWVSLAGYYSVPDYHRGLFNARRLADLASLSPDAESLGRHARQKLDIVPAAGTPAAPGREATVAIAVGGVRADRTYERWPEVIEHLTDAGFRSFRLLGSDNGRATARRLLAARPTGVSIDDQVGRLDLHATREALARAQVALAADGGLMHLVLTTSTPLVALFNDRIDPAWRLPVGAATEPLRAPGPEVSLIEPARIAEQVRQLLGPVPPRSPPRSPA